MAQPIAAVIVAEAVVPAVVGDTGAGATDVAAGIILAVDMAGTAEDAEHRHSDPVREERNNSALVGELETAPKRTAILETAILRSLAAALRNASVKLAFHPPAPPAFFGPQPDTFSFPSGHALVCACFYGVLVGLIADRIRSLYWRVLIWVFGLIVIAGVGLSRIYLGVHYPSDVIAGYLAAAGWVSSLIALDRLWLRRRT